MAVVVEIAGTAVSMVSTTEAGDGMAAMSRSPGKEVSAHSLA
jgi:hypothetical protein